MTPGCPLTLFPYLGKVPISSLWPRSKPSTPAYSPALRKAVMTSRTAALRSNAPAWAPCHSMANSPETWYTARGSSGCCGEAVGDRQIEVAGGGCAPGCPFLPATSPESLLLAGWPTLELFKGACKPWHRGRQCFPGRDGIQEVGEHSSSWADYFQL